MRAPARAAHLVLDLERRPADDALICQDAGSPHINLQASSV